MADVLSARLEKLACHFPLKDNYFAWQAFARRYPQPGEAALPAYLEPENYETIRRNAGRVSMSTMPTSPNCSPARRPRASTASSCSTRRTG